MNAVSVSAILHTGSVISTKIGANNIWYRNIVYKCEDNMVSIALIDNYMENLIMPGTKMVLKQTNECFEYIFEGVVSNIQMEVPTQIWVHVNKAEEIINTRVFPRYDTYLASDIKPVCDEKKYFSIVTNISLGGIAFASSHIFDYGEECDVSIFMSREKTVLCRGKVIRRNNKGDYIDYSMQFVDMDEINNNLVSDYLETHGKNIERLKLYFFDDLNLYFK